MLNRIAGIVGWVGTAPRGRARSAIRLFKPEYAQLRLLARVGGPGAAWSSTCSGSGATSRRRWAGSRRGSARSRSPASSSCWASSSRSTTWPRGETTAGTSPRTSSSACRRRRGRSSRSWMRRSRCWSSIEPTEFDRFRDRLSEYQYVSNKVTVEYLDPDKQPVRANQNQVQTYGTVVFGYKGRTERVISSGRAGADERADQGDYRNGAEGLLPPGPRREGHGRQRARGLQRRRRRRWDPRTSRSRRCRWRSSRPFRPTPRSSSSPARRPTCFRRKCRRCAPISQRAASCWS